MATLVPLETTVTGPFTSTGTVLSASDVIPVDAKRKQLLVLTNTTAGSLTATIDGADGTTVQATGIGPVSVAAGLAIIVPAGQSRAVVLNTVSHYLQGVVAITGGALLTAQLFNL